jgi:outer membrane protein assembly factor BamB
MSRVVLLAFSAAVALLFASGAVLALPSERPDDTPMVAGRVRTIEQVGTNVWLGGRFSRVERRDGTVLGNVGNLAVLDSQTDRYKPIAPNLGSTEAEVWDIETYGRTGDLLIAGKFDGPSSTQENLILVDGATGKVIRWYDSPALKTVLAAPALGTVYGGGRSLSAFDFADGKELWTRAETSVDPTIRTRDSKPAYRDLELDGRTIWAACVCDAVDDDPAKALVKLNIRGKHDKKWMTQARPTSFGESVVVRNGKLYLGAGGSDFLGEYDKTRDGDRSWARHLRLDAGGGDHGRQAGDRRALLLRWRRQGR